MANTEELQILVKLRDLASGGLKGLGNTLKTSVGAPLEFVKKQVFSLQGALAGLGVGLTGAGLVKLIRDTADSADKLGDLSKELDISVEKLSELKFAASQSGLELEELVGILRTGTRELAEFALTGKGGPGLRLLSEGLVDQISKGRDLVDLLPQLSREFKELDGSSRVLAANALFGRGGSRLIPLLLDDMEALERKAKELGLVLTEEDVRAADAFNDAIGELQGALVGLRNQAILPLLPLLKQFVEGLTTSIVDNRSAILAFFADVIDGAIDLKNAVAELLLPLGDLANFGASFRLHVVQRELEGLSDQLAVTEKRFQAFKSSVPDFEKVEQRRADAIKEQIRTLRLQVESLTSERDRLSKIQTTIESIAERGGGESAFDKAARAGAAALRERSAALEEAAENEKLFAEIAGLTVEEFREYTAAQEEARAVADLYTQNLEREAAALEELQVVAGDVVAEVRNHAEAEAEAAEASKLAEQAWLDETSAVRGLQLAIQDAQEESRKLGVATRQIAAGIQQSFAGGATDAILEFAEGTKTAKEAAKDFARSFLRDIARMIIQTLILKAIQAGIGGIGGAFGGGADAGVNANSFSFGDDFQSVSLTGQEKGGINQGTLRPIGLAKGGLVRDGGLLPFGGGLEAGGVVRKRALFELAEGRNAEAVVPLPDNRSIPVRFEGGDSAGARSGGDVIVQQTIIFNFPNGTQAQERASIERNAKFIAQVTGEQTQRSIAAREGLRVAS